MPVAEFADGHWFGRVTTADSLVAASRYILISANDFSAVRDDGQTAVFLLVTPDREVSALVRTRVPDSKRIHLESLRIESDRSAAEVADYVTGFFFSVLCQRGSLEFHVGLRASHLLGTPSVCEDAEIEPGPAYSELRPLGHGVTLRQFRDVIDQSPLIRSDGRLYNQCFRIVVTGGVRCDLLIRQDQAATYGFSFEVVARSARTGAVGCGSTIEEALRSADLCVGDSGWPEWIDGRLSGGEYVPRVVGASREEVELHWLLGEVSPLLSPLDHFLRSRS